MNDCDPLHIYISCDCESKVANAVEDQNVSQMGNSRWMQSMLCNHVICYTYYLLSACLLLLLHIASVSFMAVNHEWDAGLDSSEAWIDFRGQSVVVKLHYLFIKQSSLCRQSCWWLEYFETGIFNYFPVQWWKALQPFMEEWIQKSLNLYWTSKADFHFSVEYSESW